MFCVFIDYWAVSPQLVALLAGAPFILFIIISPSRYCLDHGHLRSQMCTWTCTDWITM